MIKRSIFVAGSGNTSYDPGPTFDLSPDTTVKFIDSVLEVNPTSSSVVFLSSQTNFDISGGLTVKMKGKVDVAPIVIRDDMGIASALDRMVGLKVEYTADQKKTTYVAPVKFLNKGSKSELVFECTSDTIEGCSEEVGTDDLLVVRDGDAPKFYIMDIGFVVDFVDSIPLHLYAASGEMVGTRILFSSGVQSDDGGEATSEEDIDDSDEGGKNAKPKDRDEVDLDFEGEYKDKGECPSGEYWSQNFGQCIPLPSKKSSSGVHDILKGDDGKGEPDGEYELITPTDSDIDQPIFNKEGSSDASGGGCSMIGHSDGTQNILLIIMPLLAVLFISLYRRSNGYSV